MNYKTVSDDEGFRIVNETGYGINWKVDGNLNEDELIILSLLAKECPEKKLCVRLYHRVSYICNHLGAYPSMEDSSKLSCDHGGHGKEIDATALLAENCPDNKQSCVECEYRRFVYIPKEIEAHPQKSHAYVKCGFTQE